MFYLTLFLTGMAASFVNMLAGGGSILVLGLLMLTGTDPAVANATNRVGVLISCGSGALAFRSEKFTDFKMSLKLGLCALPGAILGAIFSISITAESFKMLLSIVMVFLLISMFIPKKKDAGKIMNDKLVYLFMILVGFYGGFIQVGVGILISATLRHLGGLDLLKMSMHRVFIVLIFTIPVIVIFILSGKINWSYAAVLASGNAIGSWLTVKLALKKGEFLVKVGMSITMVLMIIKMIFFP